MAFEMAGLQVNTDDITVSWGQQPHPLDAKYGKWRLAVFQDVQEAVDSSKLYFLYDPIADEHSGTSGTRKGYPGLVLFDVNLRCFVGEIALHNPGNVKFLFALKCPSEQGGSSFVLVTEEQIYGQIKLNMFRIDLARDGLSVANSRALLDQPMTIGGEYICSMREDAPEVVVLANPGLQVWRVNCMVDSPQAPTSYFTVPGAELNHFLDGFLNNGSVYLLSAYGDGHLDHTRVHVLSLDRPGQLNTHNCTPDPQRGMPSPRKQCGIDSVPNAILFAGGEFDQGNGVVQRLVDYWILDTRSFQWLQVPAQMPVPLIEPRLTVCHSGNVYLWGDFDQPLPGMPLGGTHLRILKVSGFERAGHPPTYSQSMGHQPAPSVYPSVNQSGPTPYPSNPSQQQAPPYPGFQPNLANATQQSFVTEGFVQAPGFQNQAPAPGYGQPAPYGQSAPGYGQPAPSYGQPAYNQQNPNYGGAPPQQSYTAQHAYYPQKKKDSCSVQ